MPESNLYAYSQCLNLSPQNRCSQLGANLHVVLRILKYLHNTRSLSMPATPSPHQKLLRRVFCDDVKTDSLSSSAGYQENHFFPDRVNNQVNIFQFVPMNMKNQMKLEELKVTTTAPQPFGNMSSRPWTSTTRFGFDPITLLVRT